MKSEAEKKLIAAEIAANVHKQLVIEEAKRFTKKHSGETLLLANTMLMTSAACSTRYLMSKVDYAKLAVALQQYKERLYNKANEEYSLEDLYEALGIPPD